jgi:hypothetical protein
MPTDAGAWSALSHWRRAAGARPHTRAKAVFVSFALVGMVSGALPAFASGACSNDALRVGPSRALSDCRAYEVVSPLDKNGGSVDRDAVQNSFATSGASEAGDAVAYASEAQFAGNDSGAPWSQYRSIRSATGWSTRGIDPPVQPEGPVNSARIQIFSADLLQSIVLTNASLTPGAESLLFGNRGLYLRDDRGESTSYTLLSAPWAPLTVSDNLDGVAFAPEGATADFGHIVFNSLGRQLTQDGAPQQGGNLDNIGVYEWTGGQLRFVSVLPDGQPSVNAVAGARFTEITQNLSPGDHLLSEDGQRVYFTAAPPDNPVSTRNLYVRENGTATRLVSASERDGDDPAVPNAAEFQAAKADDGSLALFTSFQRLTNDSAADPNGSADLYLWNANAPAGARLTDLTITDPTGGGVLAIAAANDDLSRVYFVARGVLAPDAVAGAPNLYLWTAGEGVRLVATLDQAGGDDAVWSVRRDRQSPSDPVYRDARVSHDGGQLLFTSVRQLTSYDNAGHREVYLYDAPSSTLTCVSCGPSAAASGDANLFPVGETLTTGGDVHVPHRLPRNLSADGHRAFFETAQKLVSSDTNGLADVYEWSDGRLSLISSGQAELASRFVDASSDGRDVFFTTRERLASSDIDDQVDLYDARIGGGFAAPPVPVPCLADGCQGPFSIPPALAQPATGALRGSGNAQPPKAKAKKAKKCRKGFVKKRVRGKAKCVKKVKKHARRGRR